MPALALAALLLGAPLVTVAGEGPCPSSTAVAARLATLLPGEAISPDQATLEVVGPLLRIVLTAPDGTRVGERQLERSGTCEELAGTAAVVIAAWKDGAHPEFTATLGPAAEVRTAAPERQRRTRWQVEAGVGVAAAGLVPAPTALLAVSFGPAAWRTALRLAAGVSGARTSALGTGELRWSRWPLLVGPELRLLETGAVALAGRLQAGVGWLRLEGRGFDANRSHSTAAFGAAAGLQLGLRRPGWKPWVGLEVAFWPREETAYVAPGEQGARIPPWELALSAGVAFGR